MQLKQYQERVVNEVRVYLDALAKEIADGNTRHAGKDAWEACHIPRRYGSERRNGINRDLPTFCIKVPTGGGKTLLATQILGLIHKTILKSRRGAGLVLWVVPSDQIYKDTLKALRDRRHFYRESLEFALSRRIEVWEKHEIARLTPGQLASNLNILIVKLQGTNRQDKESLKFFKDSGGNIVSHFPPEDEPEPHKALKEQIANLDMIEEDDDRGAYLAATSIANLVRICEPAVILDEGHKATSKLARETIEGFNPRIVVELSATPREANVLVTVSGQELLDEEMIKLPINIANSNQKSWKNVLTAARDRRAELHKRAEKHYRASDRVDDPIRPIVLVQVERTGKDQREARFVHSEDVKEHLMQRLGVDERKIAIKTAEKDDIEGIDLMDSECPVEWIITKAALQEGWDCPMAYILVSLNNTRSQRSMTQLVGRILRQPYQQRTPFDDLNESYVYCLNRKSKDVVAEVKRALEQEGYEGDAASVSDQSEDKGKPVPARTAKIREKFRRHYKRPFEGRIFIPRFCVKNGDGYDALDYFKHLLANVDVERFRYDSVDWDFSQELGAATEQFIRVTLGKDALSREEATSVLESDERVKGWLVANLGLEWLSVKQLRRVVDEVCGRLQGIKGQMALVKSALRERVEGFIREQTDHLTQQAFNSLHQRGQLCFYLDCVEGRFEIPGEVTVRVTKRLRHDNDDDVAKSLFDFAPEEGNEYERSIALFLDHHSQVLWWYRNLVGPSHFSVQGYRKNRIYPDFIVQKGEAQRELPLATVFVLESKGKHLKGSEDTRYKREIAEIFEKVGREVTWQKLGEGFDNHEFRFQILDEGEYAHKDWDEDLSKLLTGSA